MGIAYTIFVITMTYSILMSILCDELNKRETKRYRKTLKYKKANTKISLKK